MLEELSKKEANYLELDELPIKFDDICDDSILIYRYAFQIYLVALNPDDMISLIWREELEKAKNCQ